MHGFREIVFARTKINNAASTKPVPNFAAQDSKALRRPTLRAPAAARTQNDVVLNFRCPQVTLNTHIVPLGDAQLNYTDSFAGPGTLRKLTILFGDVSTNDTHSVRIQQRNAEFADRMRGKTDPSLHPAKEGQGSGFP